MSTGNGSIAASQYAKVQRTMPKTIVSNTWMPAGVTSKVKQHKEKKKMGWIRKKFNGWVRRAWEDAHNEVQDVAIKSSGDTITGKTSVRFTIYPASGGFVIEHYKQDRYKDNEGPSLTIVNHGDELGKAVEHIIALEALRA